MLQILELLKKLDLKLILHLNLMVLMIICSSQPHIFITIFKIINFLLFYDNFYLYLIKELLMDLYLFHLMYNIKYFRIRVELLISGY